MKIKLKFPEWMHRKSTKEGQLEKAIKKRHSWFSNIDPLSFLPVVVGLVLFVWVATMIVGTLQGVFSATQNITDVISASNESDPLAPIATKAIEGFPNWAFFLMFLIPLLMLIRLVWGFGRSGGL